MKVFQHDPNGAYWTNRRGQILAANAGLAGMLGLSSPQQLRGTTLQRYRTMAQFSWNEFRFRLDRGIEFRGLETTWLRSDKSLIMASENVWSIPGPGDRPLFYQGTVKDVTGRKADEAFRVFRTVLEPVPVGLVQTDVHGVFLQTNAAFQAMLGYSEDELSKLNYSDLTHREDQPRDFQSYEELIHGRRPFYKSEKRYRRRDGSFIWVQETFSRVPGTQFATAVVEDISARKRAERRLTQRTAELEAANRELLAFAHTVAHDLRAPLRAIDGFGGMLAEEHAREMDKEARALLRRIRASARRMGALIDDLLHLSSISRSELQRESVDLSRLARDVIRSLRRADRRRCDVRIAPGVIANGDAGLLRVALENLLGNAWKFTGKQRRPRIEFGAVMREGQPIYYVGDNGVGFDPELAGKLFRPFQRLHAASEFEGSGIGLATVQRVVQRHGGRVWAAGVPRRGATFYFTLTGGPHSV